MILFDKGSNDEESEVKVENCHLLAELKLIPPAAGDNFESTFPIYGLLVKKYHSDILMFPATKVRQNLSSMAKNLNSHYFHII